MLSFLSISGVMLANPDLNSSEKLLLSYFIGLEAQGRYFYGSMEYLASMFGASIGAVNSVLSGLIEKKLLFKNSMGHIRLTGTDLDCMSYRKPSETEGKKINFIDNKIDRLAELKRKVG